MNPDLMAQLRDIHETQAVPWWPPAPGWWVLALLVLVLLAWAGKRLFSLYRDYKRRKNMLVWIDNLNSTVDPQKDPQMYLSTLNRIFKVVALRAFPGQHCALMAGQEWEEFLRGKFNDKQNTEPLRILATGPYDPAPQYDPADITELARTWVRTHG
jgi:hypothetical protein